MPRFCYVLNNADWSGHLLWQKLCAAALLPRHGLVAMAFLNTKARLSGPFRIILGLALKGNKPSIPAPWHRRRLWLIGLEVFIRSTVQTPWSADGLYCADVGIDFPNCLRTFPFQTLCHLKFPGICMPTKRSRWAFRGTLCA